MAAWLVLIVCCLNLERERERERARERERERDRERESLPLGLLYCCLYGVFVCLVCNSTILEERWHVFSRQ